MTIYRTPYTKFKFSNKVIDNQFFIYLKKTSEQDIISDIKKFKINEISEFHADYKLERICLLVGRFLALFSILSFIILINFEYEAYSDFFVIGVLALFPSLFLMSFTMSYALSLRELKKGVNERKIMLLKAQKIAKSSNDFHEFCSKIIIK